MPKENRTLSVTPKIASPEYSETKQVLNNCARLIISEFKDLCEITIKTTKAHHIAVSPWGYKTYDSAINKKHKSVETAVPAPFFSTNNIENYRVNNLGLHLPESFNESYLLDSLASWLKEKPHKELKSRSIDILSIQLADIVKKCIRTTGLQVDFFQAYWNPKYKEVSPSIFDKALDSEYGSYDHAEFIAPKNATVAIKNSLIPEPHIKCLGDALAIIGSEVNKDTSVMRGQFKSYLDSDEEVYLLEYPDRDIAKPFDRVIYRHGVIDWAELSLGFILIKRNFPKSSKNFGGHNSFQITRLLINHANPEIRKRNSLEINPIDRNLASPWGRIECLQETYLLDQPSFERVIKHELNSLPLLRLCKKCNEIDTNDQTHFCS